MRGRLELVQASFGDRSGVVRGRSGAILGWSRLVCGRSQVVHESFLEIFANIFEKITKINEQVLYQ